MKFLVLGSANYDYTYHLRHIAQPGETIAASLLETACGGKGFNQAAALAKAGANVFLAALVGSDGEELEREARGYGVDCSLLKRCGRGRTGNAMIQVDREGQNCIVLYGGTNRMWTQKDIETALADFGPGDVLVLQNEINGMPEILRQACCRGMEIVLNPSPFEPEILSWELERVSLFMLNEVEGEQMTGTDEPEEILNRLLARHPKAAAVLTLGEQGAWYADAAERVFCPAQKVKAVDTTAAGDTFTGYFLASRAGGMGTEKCLQRAAAASALAVSRKGAAVSVPTQEELEAAVQ
ncbi:MAG: ribokinase [Eubacteriales bacterium]|nr:ribokinase [Eubacteriales bacterium]